MATTVRVEGLREVDAALGELSKAVGKAVVRRALKKALAPMLQHAVAIAPVGETGQLKASLKISDKLTKTQAAQHKSDIGAKTVRTAEGWRSTPQTTVFMFMGPSGGAKSIVQEFGSAYMPPQSYMRPVWDGGAMGALASIKDDLWNEIEAAAARAARKAAKVKV
jgi:HK97 gp10 family phage protein